MKPAKLKHSKSDARIVHRIRAYGFLCWFYYGSVILLTIVELLAGNFGAAFLVFSIGLFIFWLRGAILFVLPSAERLMSADGHPELFDVEKSARLYLSALKSLPLKKEPARSILLSHLGAAKMMQGDYEFAEQCAYDSVTRFPLRQYPNEALRLYSLAAAIMRQERPERFEEARGYALQCLEICKKQKPGDQHLLGYASTILGSIEFREGNLDEARRNLEEARGSIDVKRKLPRWLPEIGWKRLKFAHRSVLGLVSAKQGRIDETKELVREIVSMQEGDPSLMAPANVKSLCELAESVRIAGDADLAEDLMRLVYAFSVKIPHHPDAPLVLSTYEALLLESGRQADVPDLKRWILPMHRDNL